jgi:hypothetical protein
MQFNVGMHALHYSGWIPQGIAKGSACGLTPLVLPQHLGCRQHPLGVALQCRGSTQSHIQIWCVYMYGQSHYRRVSVLFQWACTHNVFCIFVH